MALNKMVDEAKVARMKIRGPILDTERSTDDGKTVRKVSQQTAILVG
jgi:hypothetical protein